MNVAMRTLLLTVLWFLTLSTPVAMAKDVGAERVRLESEMAKLATRNAWTGVERTYVELQGLKTDLSSSAHVMGAQAAQDRGAMLLALERFRAAVATPQVDTPESVVNARAALQTLESRYGVVQIDVEAPRIPALVRAGQMPFSQQERESIVAARETVASERVFRGLLPIGRYMIDGEFFEIAPGQDHVVTVTKLD